MVGSRATWGLVGLVLGGLVGCRPPDAPKTPAKAPPVAASSAPAPATAPRFRSLAAGARHACVVEGSGRLSCWGDDAHGQLGDGPPTPTGDAKCFPPSAGKTPTAPALAVEGRYCVGHRRAVSTPTVVGEGFRAVVAGARHTCALRSDRRVVCFGDNTDGQLGLTGYANHVGRPIELPDVTADELRATETGVCVRAASGPFRCFGHDAAPDRAYGGGPSGEAALARFGEAKLRAVGHAFACAADEPLGVRCLGDNQFGQLGGGRSPGLIGAEAPGPVPGIEHAVQISMDGLHACARLADGGVRCWGEGHSGVLGHHLPSAFSTVPLALPVDDAVRVDTSFLRTCVLRKGGAVDCFQGMVGATPSGPQAIAPATLATAARTFAADATHACWVTTEGALACAGQWEHGTAPVASFKPASAKGVKGVVQLVADAYRTCALQQSGAVTCFGDRFARFDPPRPYGQRPTWPTPQVVTTRKGATALAMGDDWLCLRIGPRVECPIVRGTVRKTPLVLTETATALGAGPAGEPCVGEPTALSCADLDADGAPRHTIAVPDVVDLEGSCAVRKDGSVWCWGDARATGRGGVPDTSAIAVPVLLP